MAARKGRGTDGYRRGSKTTPTDPRADRVDARTFAFPNVETRVPYPVGGPDRAAELQTTLTADFDGDLGEDWTIGPKVHGGVMVALCAKAAREGDIPRALQPQKWRGQYRRRPREVAASFADAAGKNEIPLALQLHPIVGKHRHRRLHLLPQPLIYQRRLPRIKHVAQLIGNGALRACCIARLLRRTRRRRSRRVTPWLVVSSAPGNPATSTALVAYQASGTCGRRRRFRR